jgi:hypothetical protein
MVLEFIYYRFIDTCIETGKFYNHHGLLLNKLRDKNRRCIRAELRRHYVIAAPHGAEGNCWTKSCPIIMLSC